MEKDLFWTSPIAASVQVRYSSRGCDLRWWAVASRVTRPDCNNVSQAFSSVRTTRNDLHEVMINTSKSNRPPPSMPTIPYLDIAGITVIYSINNPDRQMSRQFLIWCKYQITIPCTARTGRTHDRIGPESSSSFRGTAQGKMKPSAILITVIEYPVSSACNQADILSKDLTARWGGCRLMSGKSSSFSVCGRHQ